MPEKWKVFKKKNSRSLFDFENIETFIRYGIYPSSIFSKYFDIKSNIRRGRAAKKLYLKDGHLYHGEKLVIIKNDC